MARTSIAATKAELYGLFATDANGTPHSTLSGATPPIVKVYNHEPYSGDRTTPFSLTIATAGMTPDEWIIAVRIYGDGQIGAQTVQDGLDTLMPLVEARLGGPYGPSQWEVDWVDDIQSFVATLLLTIGREDF